METGTGTQWKAAFPLQKGIMRSSKEQGTSAGVFRICNNPTEKCRRKVKGKRKVEGSILRKG